MPSSYNLPAAVGSYSGTGAQSVAIAAVAATTNNNGNLTDSAGNLQTDFVWGNLPKQPNDERADGTPAATVAYGPAGNAQWTTTTTVPSARLNPALGNHSDIEADWGNFPSFVAAPGNFMVTAAKGDGTTVTYTSQNNLKAGDVVNITGLTASAYNLSAATVATANTLKFTVTNAANAGEITGQWYGKVEAANAKDIGDGFGLGYIQVPNVVGLTLAVALDSLKDSGYEAVNITTASAVTPAISNVALTSNVATVTTAAAHGFAVGDLVTVAPVTATTLAATLVAIATVPSTTTFTYAKTTGNVASATDTGTAKVPARFNTIKTQSTAANAANVSTTATITVTPYAAS